ncbi:opioid growth factor receptor-like [Synchiropus picturatus]
MALMFLVAFIRHIGLWGRLWSLCYILVNWLNRGRTRLFAFPSVPCGKTPELGEVERGLCAGPGQPARAETRTVEEEDRDTEDHPSYRVETTDEFYCEYDSTWEAEEGHEETMKTRDSSAPRNYKFHSFRRAARDLHHYRHGYKAGIKRHFWYQTESNLDENPNLKFYCGEIPSSPDGVYISEFHSDWRGRYDLLERVHSYIQWLFPLEEPGVNPEARTLTKTEIQGFIHNDVARENLLESYKLMLDFYGIKLLNDETGAVTRADNWKERFENLNRHTHNNLRITRILKCLGTLGFAHYQAPLVHFFLEETLVRRELDNVTDSALNYFLFTVLDKRQRRRLLKFAFRHYDRMQEFVWCPRKIQSIWTQEK